jgi:NAD(P)-dependent dehydrogenase (short-subunit alcohol dehydrogenase family)
MSEPIKDKSNRVVVITGADNGIGLAMATALLEHGDRVAALDLACEQLGPLADKYPKQLRFYQCDVTDAARVQAVVNNVVGVWGQLDVLVNNACLALFIPFAQRTIDDIRRELEVDYFGYLNLILAVLPQMQKQGYGVIHNMSSGVGLTGYPGMTGYTSAKGAVESLTRTLALELAESGIVVNVMHPPLTRTKSASPLGVPVEMMADAAAVGRKLAAKVGRTEAVITPSFTDAIGVGMMLHFPVGMGRFLSGMAKRAEAQKKEKT